MESSIAWRSPACPAAETGDLVTAVLGGPVHGATVERLWNITEGNVLFLREIIEGAIAAGDLTSRDGIWRIGQSLRPGPALIDLVDLRFGSLTPSQESVIGYIALAEPVDADIVTTVTSNVEVEDAERTGMVTTFDDRGCLRLRLAHPIYGEVVRAGLPPLRRRRMLGDLADALEARGAERSDAVLALATWKLGSGRECSLDVLLAASRQARHLFDYELAERLAAAAVAMHGGTAASVARAQCLFLWGRFTAADAALASIDLDATTDRERADITIARATNMMWGIGDHEAAARLLTDATLAVSDSDALDELHALRAGLALCRVRLGDVLDLTERVAGAIRCRRAVELVGSHHPSAGAGVLRSLDRSARPARRPHVGRPESIGRLPAGHRHDADHPNRSSLLRWRVRPRRTDRRRDVRDGDRYAVVGGGCRRGTQPGVGRARQRTSPIGDALGSRGDRSHSGR